MKAGDIYRVKSVFVCPYIMRIKRIRPDNNVIFFDRIVFPKSGKIYYDIKNLSASRSTIDQWKIEKFSRKSWYILIRKLNNE